MRKPVNQDGKPLVVRSVPPPQNWSFPNNLGNLARRGTVNVSWETLPTASPACSLFLPKIAPSVIVLIRPISESQDFSCFERSSAIFWALVNDV